MDDNGWVKTHRSVFEHPRFAGKEFSEREAWIWLCTMAAWKDTRQFVSGSMIVVPRGALCVSLRQLQTVWGWQSEKRVRTFLKGIEQDGMIGRNTDAAKTLITITNYELYQGDGRAADAERTQEGRSTDALKKEAKKLIINNTHPSGVLAHPREATSDFCESFAIEAAPELPLPRQLLPQQAGEAATVSKSETVAPTLNFGEQQPQTVSAPKPPKRPRAKSAATPLPDDFEPSDANKAYAAEHGIDLNHELHQFKNYHLSKGTLSCSWAASMSTWLGRAKNNPYAKTQANTGTAAGTDNRYGYVNGRKVRWGEEREASGRFFGAHGEQSAKASEIMKKYRVEGDEARVQL
jgi:hypothetical protein